MESKVVILYYPPGAGGKFLTSCLSLASNCAFPDPMYVNTSLTSVEKFDIFMGRLDTVGATWNDFLIRPTKFYIGSDRNQNVYNLQAMQYLVDNPDLNPRDFVKLEPVDIGESTLLTLTHSIQHLSILCRIWPNAHVIYYTNVNKFVNRYRKQKISNSEIAPENYMTIFQTVQKNKRQYNDIAGADFPSFSKVLADKNNIPQEVKDEYPGLYNELLLMYYYVDFYKTMTQSCLNFNTSCYFDKQETLEQIEKVYKHLQLENFDSAMIAQLYDKWIDTVQRLQNTTHSNRSFISDVSRAKELGDYVEAHYHLSRLQNQTSSS